MGKFPLRLCITAVAVTASAARAPYRGGRHKQWDEAKIPAIPRWIASFKQREAR
jgi:hypothetical protein